MTREEPTVDFSVVISCHFEERSIAEFHERLSETLASLERSYEIIYVNDGSTDGTLAALEKIFERDPHVAAVVDLFRNSGQPAAVTAGTTHARGESFVFMDSDLQLDPEDLPRLIAEHDKGFDIVSGHRTERTDSALRRLPSLLANTAMRRLSRTDLRDFGCTYKIVDGRLLRGFEFGPFKPIRMPYLIGAAGRVTDVAVNHHPRPYGESGWTFSKLLSYFVEILVGISERPFQLLSAVLLLAGALFVVRMVVNVVWPFSLLPEVTGGLLLNVIVVSFLVGAGISAAIGEYVLRSYRLLLGQPAYVVRKLLSR